MTILLFEGLDNLGKSTLVNMFSERFSQEYNVFVMHSRAPRNLNGATPLDFQTAEFIAKAKLLREICRYEDPLYTEHTLLPCMALLDRSWLDEYVYGQLYRGESQDAVESMMDACFDVFSDTKVKICIVSLCASPEFSVAHDDGKSFTSGMEREHAVEMAGKENILFNEVFDRYVRTGCADCVRVSVCQEFDGKYRSREEIFNETVKQLADKKII